MCMCLRERAWKSHTHAHITIFYTVTEQCISVAIYIYIPLIFKSNDESRATYYHTHYHTNDADYNSSNDRSCLVTTTLTFRNKIFTCHEHNHIIIVHLVQLTFYCITQVFTCNNQQILLLWSAICYFNTSQMSKIYSVCYFLTRSCKVYRIAPLSIHCTAIIVTWCVYIHTYKHVITHQYQTLQQCSSLHPLSCHSL